MKFQSKEQQINLDFLVIRREDVRLQWTFLCPKEMREQSVDL